MKLIFLLSLLAGLTLTSQTVVAQTRVEITTQTNQTSLEIRFNPPKNYFIETLGRYVSYLKPTPSATSSAFQSAKDCNANLWSQAKGQSTAPLRAHNPASPFTASIKIDTTDATDGQWYCFALEYQRIGSSEVKTQYFATRFWRPGVERTVNISIRQIANQLIASADREVEGQTWQYAVTDSEPACTSNIDTKELTFSKASRNAARPAVTATDIGRWYCFKVAEASGTYSYGKIQIFSLNAQDQIKLFELIYDANAVSLNIKPVAATQDAIDATSWQYASSATDFSCDETADFKEANWSASTIALSKNSNPFWCVRVAANDGRISYAKSNLTLELKRLAEPVATTQPDASWLATNYIWLLIGVSLLIAGGAFIFLHKQ